MQFRGQKRGGTGQKCPKREASEYLMQGVSPSSLSTPPSFLPPNQGHGRWWHSRGYQRPVRSLFLCNFWSEGHFNDVGVLPGCISSPNLISLLLPPSWPSLAFPSLLLLLSLYFAARMCSSSFRTWHPSPQNRLFLFSLIPLSLPFPLS